MAQDRSPVIDLSSGNAEMNAAIAKGRATLPTFWASYDAPKPSETGHSLKVRFPNPRNNGEHIWIADVKKTADGRYSGRFANAPRDLPGKKAGEVALFKEADISDWMFTRNGKIVGGETIRPLLKSLPKADADALRARMEHLEAGQGQSGRASRNVCQRASTMRNSPGHSRRKDASSAAMPGRTCGHGCPAASWLVPTPPMAEKPKKPQKLRARLPRGLEDRGPAAIAATRQMVEKIREVYERYGFEPVETPAMEFTDALGKFLPDQDRPNEGVFSFQDDDEQWISLRYDLTAPLARYVAENFDALPKPYRSYRAGYVYRNEKPGPGRFRQFMQFDADTVGSASPAADAEMCMMAADTMEALGIPRGSYLVKVNNRKVLDGVRRCARYRR